MVNNISNNHDILTNNSIRQQQELQSIEKKPVSKNPYVKSNDYIDQSEISSEALKLYEKDMDIQKFKKLVLDDFDVNESTKEIKNLIDNGVYNISDEDLAESLVNDEDFVDLIFPE